MLLTMEKQMQEDNIVLDNEMNERMRSSKPDQTLVQRSKFRVGETVIAHAVSSESFTYCSTNMVIHLNVTDAISNWREVTPTGNTLPCAGREYMRN